MRGDKKSLINRHQFPRGDIEGAIDIAETNVRFQNLVIVNFRVEWPGMNERLCVLQSATSSVGVSCRLIDLRKFKVGTKFERAQVMAFCIGSDLIHERKCLLATPDLNEQEDLRNFNLFEERLGLELPIQIGCKCVVLQSVVGSLELIIQISNLLGCLGFPSKKAKAMAQGI